MTTLDFHINVEQEVQKISSFAYENIEPEELDIQANKSFYQFLNDFVTLQPRGNQLNDTEARLNDIRSLVIRDTPLSAITNDSVSVASLPNSYLYLVGLKADVYTECNKVTELVPNNFYLLKVGSYVIDSVTYPQGSIVKTLNKLTVPKDTFVQMTFSQRPVRIVSNADYYDLEDSHYGKSTKKSPLGSVWGNQISISTKGFLINKVYLSFVRKPKAVSIATPNEEIELPINSTYKLIALTALNIMKVTEQPQQKIVNSSN